MQAIRAGIRPRRPSLYDQRVEDAARAVQDAVDAVAAMGDPAERAAAATAVLAVISKANGTLAKLRQQDIKAMRAAGLSYGQIGDAIGVHRTRAKQIESGAPMGNSARGRAAKEGPAPE